MTRPLVTNLRRSRVGRAAVCLLLAFHQPAVAKGPGGDDSVEIERRPHQRARGDIAAHVEATGRADIASGKIVSDDPAEEVHHGLARRAEPRPFPRDSGPYWATHRILPRGFRTYETERFIILSNAGSRWTRSRGKLLERTYEQFQRQAKRLELRPLPLRHKLVCVLFRSREQFAEFAREHDRVTESWGLGYYSPRNDRMVFFDGESEKDADEFAEKRSVATTIHEAVHQLLFHTRVQNVNVQYPLWSGEGLATAFESGSPNGAFGPDYEFDPRRLRFRRLRADDRLIPLRTLVQLDRMPDNRRATVHTVYNQSYALVCWLARNRQRGLRDYLMSMLKEPPGRPAPQRHLELFEQAFGDVDQVEEAWLAGETSAEDVP